MNLIKKGCFFVGCLSVLTASIILGGRPIHADAVRHYSTHTINKNRSVFACGEYNHTTPLERILDNASRSFYLEMPQGEVEKILLGECHAKRKNVDLGFGTNSSKAHIVYELPNLGVNTPVSITYQGNKIWDFYVGTTRLIPEEPMELDTQLAGVVSIDEVKKNPEKFRFEYYPDEKELAEVLDDVFNIGTPKKFVDQVLKKSGHAEILETQMTDKSGNKIRGYSYNYYLPTKDGRKYAFSRRSVVAGFDREKLILMYLKGNRRIDILPEKGSE